MRLSLHGGGGPRCSDAEHSEVLKLTQADSSLFELLVVHGSTQSSWRLRLLTGYTLVVCSCTW